MARVVMQKRISIAANSTVVNVLSDEKYVRAPGDAIGTCMNTGSATGLEASLNVGGSAVSDVVDVGARNEVPIVPDDDLISGWLAKGGNLIQLTVTNTTGGALIYFYRVVLDNGRAGGWG